MLLLILLLFVLLYLVIFFLENYPAYKRAPGPLRFPPFGSLVQVALAHKMNHVGLHNLAKKYGDVMSVKIGFVDAVVLSSYEAVKQIFVKEEASARECSGIIWDRNLKKNIGLIFCNGDAWAENHDFCRKTLRNYGYGDRVAMKNLMTDELAELIKCIDDEANSSPDRTVHFRSVLFDKSFMNILSSMVLGKRFNYNDKALVTVLTNLKEFANNANVGPGLMVAFPFLRYIFPEALGYNLQMKGLQGYLDAIKDALNERRLHDYANHPTCFVDEYLKKIDEDDLKPNPFYTEEQLGVLYQDILQAGTETSGNVATFLFLLLAAHPEVQEKVYEEIENVIGQNRLPDINDRTLMPHTQSAMLEALRWGHVAVFGAPRKAVADFVYKDCIIKKDTVIMPNFHSVMFDETYWEDPEVFRPARFLCSDGTLDAKKTKRVNILFGAGKRMCFGEVLARDSMFLFTTNILQKFKFELPPGTIPNLEPVIGITLRPHPFDAIVTPKVRPVL